MKKTFAILGLTLLTGLTSQTVLADQAQDITVKAPFAREVPPGAPASASFMTLENTSNKAVKVVSAQSNVANTVELHTHTNDNGVMRMRQIQFIEIPASGTTELKPGGLHIMLINPKHTLKQGQEVKVTLNFEDGSKKTVTMPVKSLMGMMKPQMNHDHNHEHNMDHHHH